MDRPSERPVNMRTSQSAEDFWSRPWDSGQLSPDFKVKKPCVVQTPFGRQLPPTLKPNIVRGALPPLAASRVVERRTLQLALRDAENIPPTNHHLMDENRRLTKDVQCLRKQLACVLKINHALTGAMARQAQNEARV